MKKIIKMMAMFSMMLLALVSCGGGDDPATDDGGTTAPAPKVVSTSIANGATDVAIGDLEIDVVYSDQVKLTSTDAAKIQISGGSVKSIKCSAKTLTISVNCPTEGEQVAITIPSTLVVGKNSGLNAESYSFSFTMYKKPDMGSDNFESAREAVKKMIAGWNLGNTLDACDWNGKVTDLNTETYWGQPKAEAFLMKKLKEKGFTAIRVPVTWMPHMDADGNVDAAWMNRVEEVVNYVLDNGMYCIINVHHDTGADAAAWLKADGTTYAATNAKFKKLWTQIANHFNKYNEKLLFEGYNEMLTGSNPSAQWTQPSNLANLDYINKYAKDFVEAVRATGGNNTHRNLIITTYSASPNDNTLGKLVIPTDPCGNQSHLVVEVHTYAPWNWVNVYNKKWTAACKGTIENEFRLLDKYIIKKGYPVIIGEYGSNGENENTIDKNSTHEEKLEAGKQATDMVTLCKQYDAACFYWMGIVDGNDRKESSFKWSMEEVADAIVNAAK